MGHLSVDTPQRMSKMRAHTATHLLHMVIQNYFPTTRQAGSRVDDDYLRFDYTADRAFTDKELDEIQYTLNTYIYDSHNVSVTEMSYDDACRLGAKAFFEDKYGDTVRVVRIDNTTSVELCGGTHVTNTSHIGCCIIDKHEAVASGIKRISAYTGVGIMKYIDNINATLQPLYTHYNTSHPGQLVEKITKQIKELQDLQSSYDTLQHSLVTHTLDALQPRDDTPAQLIIDLASCKPLNMKQIVAALKERPYSAIVYNATGQFAIVGNDTLDAKTWAQSHNLRGGGNKHLFQGKDTAILTHL